MDLAATLLGQDLDQRGLLVGAVDLELLRLDRNRSLCPNRPIDGHPSGDRPNPTAEGDGVLQLVDLPHCLDEHLLGEFLRFGIVTQPSHGRGVHGPIVSTEQLVERFSLATLGGQYEYRITKEWGAGALTDITFGSDTSFVLGGAGYWHPVKPLTLLAAPSVDFNNDDFFVRIGGSYDFEVKDFLLGPAVYVDLGAKNTPVMLGLVVSFDF